MPTDWRFWERFGRHHFERCDELVVLMLDGWRESQGVQAEIEIARWSGKPVSFIEPVAEENPGQSRG